MPLRAPLGTSCHGQDAWGAGPARARRTHAPPSGPVHPHRPPPGLPHLGPVPRSVPPHGAATPRPSQPGCREAHAGVGAGPPERERPGNAGAKLRRGRPRGPCVCPAWPAEPPGCRRGRAPTRSGSWGREGSLPSGSSPWPLTLHLPHGLLRPLPVEPVQAPLLLLLSLPLCRGPGVHVLKIHLGR